jgi:LacI family transcriptional regulator
VIFADFTQEGGYNAFKTLIFEHPEITAIFHASDLMAMGSYRAAKDLGMRIPEDISLVGFDDIELASLITPALTTIRQDTFKMGYTAAKHLLAIIRGEKPQHIVIPHKLVVRDSARKL